MPSLCTNRSPHGPPLGRYPQPGGSEPLYQYICLVCLHNYRIVVRITLEIGLSPLLGACPPRSLLELFQAYHEVLCRPAVRRGARNVGAYVGSGSGRPACAGCQQPGRSSGFLSVRRLRRVGSGLPPCPPALALAKEPYTFLKRRWAISCSSSGLRPGDETAFSSGGSHC